MCVPNFGMKILFGFFLFFIPQEGEVNAYVWRIPSASMGKNERVFCERVGL